MKKISILTIIFLAIFASAQASAIWISGHVSNPSGTSIPEVLVSVKGNGQTTKTNSRGMFRISAEKNNHLVFTHPNFQEKTISVNEDTTINVVLIPITQEILPEDAERKNCVSIGYYKNKTGTSKISGRNKMVGFANSGFVSGRMLAPDWNTENYASINEPGYKDVYTHPLSTFSIDVDNAAYSNVRRFLNMGQMPPADAVRIEEMINYFNYNYAPPTGDDPFAIYTETGVCPWNTDHNLLLVGLQAKEIDKTKLPPSNLVFLLDVSGSMQAPNKLPLVKSAMRMLVNELRPNDKVAIVVYAGAAGVALEPTSGNQKQKIMNAIDQLEAGGSTAGGEGLKLAYQTARENFRPNGNNRIILATDGDFNVGVSSTSEMERLVEKERESGIFMTVLGFGMGNYKDDKMETIADKGNGNYAYIDNIQEAQKVLIKEFGGTLFTVAKDVKLQLEFNPQYVKAYRLIGYENRLLNEEDFKDDKKDAGEMGSGHQVTALYEIVPAGSNENIPKVDELKYQQNKKETKKAFDNELVTIKARYKKPDGTQSIEMIKTVSPKIEAIEKTSDNFRFVSAVAGFGMLLRQSEYSGTINYKNIEDIAKKAKGNDEDGYRSEFARLIEVAANISQQTNEE